MPFDPAKVRCFSLAGHTRTLQAPVPAVLEDTPENNGVAFFYGAFFAFGPHVKMVNAGLLDGCTAADAAHTAHEQTML